MHDQLSFEKSKMFEQKAEECFPDDEKASLTYLATCVRFDIVKSLKPKAEESTEGLLDCLENVTFFGEPYTTPQVMGNCQYTSWTEALKIAARLKANKIEGFTPEYLTEEILGVKKEAAERTAWNFAYKMVRKYRGSLDDRMTEKDPDLKARVDSLLTDTASGFKTAQAALDARLKREQTGGAE